jgi:imidazoleglycerol phosphate synthase glutamine amidotransferase subunit HisH
MIYIIDNTIGPKKCFKKLIESVGMYTENYYICNDFQKLKYLLSKVEPSGFILSGSQLMLTERDYIEYKDFFDMNFYILEHYSHKPILGICFGAQIITTFFGGKLQKLERKLCKTVEDYYFCLTYILKIKPPKSKIHIKVDGLGPVFLSIRNNIYMSFFHPEYHKKTWKIIHSFLNICINK